MNHKEKLELFCNSQGLVHSALSKYFPQYAFDEDMLQEARIGLWNACNGFNEDKGKFSTWAYTCILNEVRMRLRKKRVQTVSLQTPVPSTDGDLTYEDTLEDRKFDMSYAEVDFPRAFGKLTPKQKQIVSLRLSGYNQIQIAGVLGNSQGYVSRLLKQAELVLRNNL